MDGTLNNAIDSSLGAAGTALLRLGESDYPDDETGTTMLTPPVRPNARDISNYIANQFGASIPNQHGLSGFAWQWGQFIDHDIDHSRSHPTAGTAPISVTDPSDPMYPSSIAFDRSLFMAGSGVDSPRQQINSISSYIDASNIYGSDDATAAQLRTSGGLGARLETSAGNLLPIGPDGHFLAGDERANEHVGLTAMHTLFVREHNRLIDLLEAVNPLADSEDLYQTARKIVGAELQIITYNEFLPSLLGIHASDPSAFRYDVAVNPSIANEFSTALFRVGHTMLPTEFLLLTDRNEAPQRLALRDAFFNPSFLKSNPENLEGVLFGLYMNDAQEIDTRVVDDVRNFLFGSPGAGGMDLAALNIQRGRDHGLPDYNSMRQAYGLDPVANFDDITSDPVLQQSLMELYETVWNIDPWVGALAEDHIAGAAVGELISSALIDQFGRLAEGDKFFFLWDPDLESEIVSTVIDLEVVTLSHIIELNTHLDMEAVDVFTAGVIYAPSTIILTIPVLALMFRRYSRSKPRLA